MFVGLLRHMTAFWVVCAVYYNELFVACRYAKARLVLQTHVIVNVTADCMAECAVGSGR